MAWDTLVEIYLRFRRESDAVKVMEERLQTQPDDVAALVNFGGLKMRVGQFAEALQTTDRALSIEPRNEDARFNRALIYTAMSRWDAAQRDFQFLLERTAARRRIQSLYGLAGVYFLRSNHADSLSCYKEFLKDTAPSEPPTFEIQTARSRVRMLEKRLDYERLAEPGYVIPGTGQLRH